MRKNETLNILLQLMKQSIAFIHTLRNPPADAEVVSHRLLAQAGFIHKLAAGIYSYTPPLKRVLDKISQIIRDEMSKAGAEEAMLAMVQPKTIWEESGRWDQYVNDGLLFHLEDRKSAELCLGPTHEEVMTKLVSHFVESYKQLPVNLYQIQDKFRDEIRPRFGLMRGREFIMKDGYSFDANEEGMNRSYLAMKEAYSKIFARCGLLFILVEADSGAIGGSCSQEFVVTASTGEDVFLICDELEYAANQERAESIIPNTSSRGESPLAIQKVSTPNVRSIEELCAFFDCLNPDRIIKTLLYKAIYNDREEFLVTLIRGDREVNEVKLKNHLNCLSVSLASDVEVKNLTGVEIGFLGPVKLAKNLLILADSSIDGICNGTTGANEKDFHFVNVNIGRDFSVSNYIDIGLAKAGDTAINGNAENASHKLRATRGIEVGHIFKLGEKYSKAMNATFVDSDGQAKSFVMGTYGIGVSRVAAAAIEQSHDDKGMIWPLAIAPWAVHLICINPKNDAQAQVADKLYRLLLAENIDVLYDDRSVSAGIKFNDADLIGIPLRVIVGKLASSGKVEFVERKCLSKRVELEFSEVLPTISKLL